MAKSKISTATIRITGADTESLRRTFLDVSKCYPGLRLAEAGVFVMAAEVPAGTHESLKAAAVHFVNTAMMNATSRSLLMREADGETYYRTDFEVKVSYS